MENYEEFLSRAEKHQLAKYLWKSGWKHEYLPLFSVDKLSILDLSDIVKFYIPYWLERKHESSTLHTISSPLAHLCPILQEYFLTRPDYDLLDVKEKVYAPNYCYGFSRHAESIAMFGRMAKSTNNDTFTSRSRFNWATNNMAVDYLFLGDFHSGRRLSKLVYSNLLNEFHESFFNMEGNKRPYDIKFIDELLTSDQFPKEMLVLPKPGTIEVKSLPLTNSTLSPPRNIVRFEDRKTTVIRLINVLQDTMGLWRFLNNDFIVYDCGQYTMLDNYANLLAEDKPIPLRQFNHGIFITCFMNNYYHWLVEGMGRIALLIRNGFFNEFPDAVLVTYKANRYITEALALIKFPEDRIIYVDIDKEKVFFKVLHMPIFDLWQFEDERLNNGVNSVAQHVPTCHVTEILNKLYNPQPLPLKERKKIIYVGRANQTARKTFFDAQLNARMRAIFGNDYYSLQSASVAEQSRIFSQARVIFGPHGAALSNIIFAAPNQTAVIEFPVDTIQFDFFYPHLASCLGMYYWTLPSMLGLHKGNYDSSPQHLEDVINAVVSAAEFMKTKE